MPHAERIAELLLDIGAVKLSVDPPFTWTSGIKSPIYCDNRMIYGHPEARKFVVDAFVSRINALHIEPDVIAGTATAAIGWAALVAEKLDLPLVYVRSKAKEHGAKKLIEGDMQEEKDVVLIEDLISTGGSAINSVSALREEKKSNIKDICAIFTYEMEKSKEREQEANVKYHTLSDFTTLLEVASSSGRLSEEEKSLAVEWARDPENWGK